MKKGIYLASGQAFHKEYNIIYQDISNNRDIGGDMMNINLDEYDYLIATPPCNYYSRCNYRRDSSNYALLTKHLLPDIIDKFINSKKPFIVENVRNEKLFKKLGLLDKPCLIYYIGRHTYWTNIFLIPGIKQRQDFKGRCKVIKYEDMNNTYHQGGYNVHQVIDYFLEMIENGE